MTAHYAETRAPRWLMASVRAAEAPAAPVAAALGAGVWLCAWPAEGDAGLRAAARAAAPVLRGNRGVLVAIGAALEYRGTLLGLTPSNLERHARRAPGRRGWRLTHRVSEALHAIADEPEACEILARAQPSVGARWTAWAEALDARARRDEAAVVRQRAERLGRQDARRALAQMDADLAEAGRQLAAGHLARAAALYEACEARARAGGERGRLLRAMRGRLTAFTRLDDLAAAERVCTRALSTIPTAPMLATTDDVVEGMAMRDVREAQEAVAFCAAAARAAIAGGRIGEARNRFRVMLEVADMHGLLAQARRARLGLAWTELRAGNADLAAGWSEKVFAEARGTDPAVAAHAAWVSAEARFALSDFDAAARLLDATERALDDGVWSAASAASSDEPLPWVVASLRARDLRRRHEQIRALDVLERAIAEVERAGVGTSGGPWPDARLYLYGLAAEIAASLGDWDRVGRWAAAATSPSMPSGGPPPAPTTGMDVVTLLCGTEDVIVLHEGGRHDAIWLQGLAPLVRTNAREIVDAQITAGPLQAVLSVLSQTFGTSLHPLAASGRTLAVRADDELRPIPWDLVPVHGRALTTHRPVVELAAVRPRPAWAGAPGVGGRCLLGPGAALGPADRATLVAAGATFGEATRAALREPAAWTLLWCAGGPRRLTLADGEAAWWDLAEDSIPGGIFLLGGAWPSADIASERISSALVAAGADAVVTPAIRVPEPECRALLVDLAARLAAGEPLLRAFQLARVRAASSFGPWGWTALAPYRLVVGGPDLVAAPG